MDEWLPLAITIGTILLLLWSGHWANRRYADFEMLPGYYDLKGRGCNLKPRATMAWQLPIIYSIMTAALAAMLYYESQDYEATRTLLLLIGICVSLLGANVISLWEVEHWVRQNRKKP